MPVRTSYLILSRVFNKFNLIKDYQPEKKKVKRSKWSKDDDVEFLQVWEVHRNELRQAKRNSHIYAKMSEEMGGRFTAQEVHTKITNFTQKYRYLIYF